MRTEIDLIAFMFNIKHTKIFVYVYKCILLKEIELFFFNNILGLKIFYIINRKIIKGETVDLFYKLRISFHHTAQSNKIGQALGKVYLALTTGELLCTGPDLDWKQRKKEISIEVLKNPKDDNSILWRGSLKVATGKENAGEIIYTLEENIFPLKDGHS
ncbi:hypothetical protein Avbf_06260 [Armadillidium vulgare]|nr:hypothetical protein Avbf_06260 [Armadillidium vulgare]